MTPRCFDTDFQYVSWVQADKIVQAARTFKPSIQCLDCTPEYAERMRREGRCEKPTVAFKRINGGELIGYEPELENDDADMVGVYYHKLKEQWVARVWGKGRYRNIGYYATKQEAKQARVYELMHRRTAAA